MPQIWLIRHGQTHANAAGVLQGHLQTELNAVGHQQAQRIAGRLRLMMPGVDVLVTSDLRRAEQTAAPIAKALGLAPIRDAAWRERGFGTLEGQSIGEVEIWRAAAGSVEPPGGETAAAFEDRVADVLVATAGRAGDGGVVAVVTHGGPMRMVLALLQAGRLPAAGSAPVPPVQPIANGSLLQLEVRRTTAGLEWEVLAVNDVAHLGHLSTSEDAG